MTVQSKPDPDEGREIERMAPVRSRDNRIDFAVGFSASAANAVEETDNYSPCVTCGYDLRGTRPECNCPECGQSYDPSGFFAAFSQSPTEGGFHRFVAIIGGMTLIAILWCLVEGLILLVFPIGAIAGLIIWLNRPVRHHFRIEVTTSRVVWGESENPACAYGWDELEKVDPDAATGVVWMLPRGAYNAISIPREAWPPEVSTVQIASIVSAVWRSARRQMSLE